MDEWSAGGMRVNLGQSDAQTYCNRIYFNDPKSDDTSQLSLVAHELIHSKQCEQLGGAGKFGYHYFKEYKRANQSYENNKLEKEAFAFENQFHAWLQTKPAPVERASAQIASVFGYIKNSRLVATGKAPEAMDGHVNWALNTGQSYSRVKEEILLDLNQARSLITQSPSMQACEAFGHMKNGMLTLFKETTEAHTGHVNWCRIELEQGRWSGVVSAMDLEFVFPIQNALK